MTIKQFTESAISVYLENGGTVHPDITLDIFQLIESNKSLLDDYNTLSKGANPTIGKFIRQHFDLRNDKQIEVAGRCSFIKDYMMFHKK